MKAFFFLVAIPMVTGIATSYFGVGWFSGDILTAALINVPVCLLSCAVHFVTE